MARQCSICSHEHHEIIDKAILEGVPNSRIAEDFGLSETSVRRHVKNGHISDKLVKAKVKTEISSADDLTKQLNTLVKLAWKITGETAQSGDNQTALKGIREVRECIRVMLEVLGKLQTPQTQVNILINPEFVAVRTLIMNAVSECPECRKRLSEALKHV